MTYSDINFEKFGSVFTHNLDHDFACFALWKDARVYRERIRSLLGSRFEILLETEIEWSERWFHDNASRIYEEPILNGGSPDEHRSVHGDKIGDNRFILFVVKDYSSCYTFAMSVSKRIELANLNVVETKYEIRDWINRDLNVRFAVHATNNIYEFFFQTPLLLGIDLFDKLLRGERLNIKRISKDLEGAGGWSNYCDLFKILNLTSQYLVQTGFETLPHNNDEKNLDLLAANYQRLASSLGMRQTPEKPNMGEVLIDDEMVSVDIRYVGDNHFDASWQKDMLTNKVCEKGVFIPREDDYFFSLLYHCKVRSGEVEAKYISILEKIAKKMKFDWFSANVLANDKTTGLILKGYFESQGYYYKKPIDKETYQNMEVIRYLPVTKIETRLKSTAPKFKALLKRMIPESVMNVLKKHAKKISAMDAVGNTFFNLNVVVIPVMI